MVEHQTDLKPLSESMKKPMAKQLGEQLEEMKDKIFNWDWVFSTVLEKSIIVFSVGFTIITIIKYIYALFK